MMTLVIGGANSGKSAYAEELVLRQTKTGRPLYLATMQTGGSEADARIAKHRKAREGKGFLTVECARALERCELPDCETVLLEDLGNLCANELFTPEGSSADVCETALAEIRYVARHCRHLVIVSVETALGGTDYGKETVRFLETMGRLHCALVKEADAVTEVACGIPVFHKGKEPA